MANPVELIHAAPCVAVADTNVASRWKYDVDVDVGRRVRPGVDDREFVRQRLAEPGRVGGLRRHSTERSAIDSLTGATRTATGVESAVVAPERSAENPNV